MKGHDCELQSIIYLQMFNKAKPFFLTLREEQVLGAASPQYLWLQALEDVIAMLD